MCLNPIKIRNPTLNISRSGGQKLMLEVQCNKCAECQLAKRAEWSFRSYQELQHTLRTGGFVYFDTLTYSPKHLPMLSDFVDVKKYKLKNHSCFCHAHFKLFLKNLRRQLNYHYKGVTFKYFLTSEYGADDRYTHRPHYHILFYVYGVINPLDFSRLVSKCWSYGRTDGLPYHSIAYVSEHIYGRNVGFGANNSVDVTTAVCGYVAKYITKSSKFQEQLNKRIFALKCRIDDEEYIKQLVRQVDMFHRQSQGFGCSYLYHADERERALLAENKCLVPDKKKVFVTLPLPMYYKRKMYYVQKKRDDGRRYWELTDNGYTAVVENQLKQVPKEITNYKDIMLNCENKEMVSMANDLLCGRDLREFVVYDKFYRGRMRHGASLNLFNLTSIPNLDNIEFNLYDWLQVCAVSSKSNSLPSIDTLPVTDDGHVLIRKADVPFTYFQSIYNSHVVDFKTFAHQFTFNESYPEFQHFDKLKQLFQQMTKNQRKQKQQTFDFLEDYKERMKELNL